MAIPNIVTDLSSTNASNSPQGSDSIGTSLDDFLRAHAGIIRQESLNKGWERWGDAPTQTSATTFTVVGDLRSRYVVGRRLKAIDSSNLTGTISGTSFASGVTTITLALDAGSLSGSLSEVQLGLDILSYFPTSVIGTTTNDNAAAGSVGEYFSTTLNQGSAFGLTNNTSLSIVSQNVPPGDWDIWADLFFYGAATTTCGGLQASIGTTDNVINGAPGFYTCVPLPSGSTPFNVLSFYTLKVGPVRVSLASLTTVYATALATFGVSTLSCFGIIQGRRRR